MSRPVLQKTCLAVQAHPHDSVLLEGDRFSKGESLITEGMNDAYKIATASTAFPKSLAFLQSEQDKSSAGTSIGLS